MGFVDRSIQERTLSAKRNPKGSNYLGLDAILNASSQGNKKLAKAVAESGCPTPKVGQTRQQTVTTSSSKQSTI
jgi:hypothetical protein